MADDRSLRGPQIVNGSICPRTTRLAYWLRKWGVSHEQLAETVQ